MLVFLGAFFWSFFFFEETEDDTMFVVKQICCSTFWLGCGRCSVYKDHVKSWVFHANYQKQLAFQKEKTPLETKIHVFFVRFLQHLHKTLQNAGVFFYVTSIDSVDPPLGEADGKRCDVWVFRVVKGHLTVFGGARNPERFPPL